MTLPPLPRVAALAALLAACGGTNVDVFPDARADGAALDTTLDVAPDAAPDASPDARPDASPDARPDAPLDAPLDVPSLDRPDAAPDARPDAPVDVAVTCATAADCGGVAECVFPEAACGAVGRCMPPMGCAAPATYCGCDGETYTACRPSRPTRARGACVTGSFCARALCGPPAPRCCESLMRCIATTEACPGDAPDAGLDAPPPGCVSRADCGGVGECVFATTGCATRGVCMPSIACLRPETFCACDGATYTGCRPDRPTRAMGACAAADAGVDAPPPTCRDDRDCGAGQSCCGFTGRCYDTRCLSCCMFPPPDAAVDAPGPCRANSECPRGQFCNGAGCGTPGACAALPDGCLAVFDPVCGCDARTYSNACVANMAGVRVSSRGACM